MKQQVSNNLNFPEVTQLIHKFSEQRNPKITVDSRGRSIDYEFRAKSVIERFCGKIVIDPITGCWIWRATKNYNGYAKFSVADKKILAHRFIWEYLYGEIPKELEINHKCRNRACQNPEHLELLTHIENVRYCKRKPRSH